MTPVTASPPPTLELPISRMTCAMCQKNVARALNRTDGVISASVNLASEKGQCELPARRRAPPRSGRRGRKRRLRRNRHGQADRGARRRRSRSPTSRDQPADAPGQDRRRLHHPARPAQHDPPLSCTRFAIPDGQLRSSWRAMAGSSSSPPWPRRSCPAARQANTSAGALKSLRNGSANMDVLVSMGSLAAYLYGIIVLLGIVLEFL